MTKRKKREYIKPNMKFNPGTMSFQPELPLTNKKTKLQINWKWLIGGAIILIIIITLMILLAG